ncbi:hypothetical protein ACWEQL_17800 [Kitasatospora sp. NPDC004240]
MSWDVVAEEKRIRWTSEPLRGVGPLQFGMTPGEAEEALHGVLELGPWRSDVPHYGTVLSREYNPPHTPAWPAVTAYFNDGRLAGVAIDALRGPQVCLAGIPLVGRAPSRLAADLTEYTDTHDIFLRYTSLGDLASEELGFFGATQRADDLLLTRPVLVGISWADRLGDSTETHLPPAEWRDRR